LKTETGEIISKKEALVREAMECGFQRFEAEAFHNCLRKFQEREREKAQGRIETLYAMYELATKQRDYLMDQQRAQVEAMRGRVQ
jgi:hypothetical protein